MPGHQGENLYKIGPNKFMGGGGVCGRGEKGGAFCLVCIFHNQKMHVYLISRFSSFIISTKKLVIILGSSFEASNTLVNLFLIQSESLQIF